MHISFTSAGLAIRQANSHLENCKFTKLLVCGFFPNSKNLKKDVGYIKKKKRYFQGKSYNFTNLSYNYNVDTVFTLNYVSKDSLVFLSSWPSPLNRCTYKVIYCRQNTYVQIKTELISEESSRNRNKANNKTGSSIFKHTEV